ncbi:MAG: GNAT family N-acetyltransferase [Caldilineae bacterium]|nr:MAG: GNAT family N-acetyltransferase [Caldilineae bacterium]
MRVQRLAPGRSLQATYPCATESPPPFWADGLSLSRAWFAHELGRSVEGFHLLNERDEVIGHIYWAPSEHALVPYRMEAGIAYEYCEWIQREWQGQGGMQRLFEAFVRYLRREGYKGILVDGTDYEGYMHYSHFLKRGFRILREQNGGHLLYYPLSQDEVRVEPIPAKLPETCRTGICIFGSQFCPVGASAVLYVRRAVQDLGGRVPLTETPATRDTVERYGIADGIYLKGKPAFFGPVTEQQVRRQIEEEFGLTSAPG